MCLAVDVEELSAREPSACSCRDPACEQLNNYGRYSSFIELDHSPDFGEMCGVCSTDEDDLVFETDDDDTLAKPCHPVENSRFPWSGEWLKARWNALETSVPGIATQPRVEDDGEAPLQVSVGRARKKRKLNKNQRRATVRSRETEPFALLDEEGGSVPICAAGHEWERLEMTVDSGAAETIGPTSAAPNVEVVAGDKLRAGVKYTCAEGKSLPNLGEKRCIMASDESHTEHVLNMQVAAVNRPLLSVSKAIDSGNKVVFDKEWSYTENKGTGERTTLNRQGGLFTLDAWVKARPMGDPGSKAPFQRPGAN